MGFKEFCFKIMGLFKKRFFKGSMIKIFGDFFFLERCTRFDYYTSDLHLRRLLKPLA